MRSRRARARARAAGDVNPDKNLFKYKEKGLYGKGSNDTTYDAEGNIVSLGKGEGNAWDGNMGSLGASYDEVEIARACQQALGHDDWQLSGVLNQQQTRL